MGYRYDYDFDDDFDRPRRRPSGANAKKRRKRRRRRILQAVLPVFIAIVLIVIVIIVGINTGLFDSFSYSTKKADLVSYFAQTSENTATVIRNGDITEERITVKDGHLYCDLDQIKSEYNDGFYWEEFDNKLLYTTGDGIYSVGLDSPGYDFNGSALNAGYTICYMDGETLMIALDYVKLFTNLGIKLCGGASEPYRAMVSTSWGEIKKANVTDDTALRISADKQSDILTELDEGAQVTVYENGDEWMKVMTDDLITGYLETKCASDVRTEMEQPVNDVAPVNVTKVADYSKQVILAWHNVTTQEAASYLSDYDKYLDNINTISPTWFAIADDEGEVASIAQAEYVTKCHEKGIKVWGLVDNMTYQISSYNVLSNPSKRAKIISQLLSLAAEYNLDGINVDFEMLTSDAAPHFVQFVRELSLAAHKQNLVISVDNYVPMDYSKYYNRKAQGMFADYVVIMGYDEHTSGSSEAGSVASLEFVMDGIDQTLAEVPQNEIINGVPFYTRYWEVSATGEILDVQNLPMSTAKETVAKSGATPKWDEATGQNYVEWTSDGTTKKIWLEDADSLGKKLQAMKSRNINGVAVWQLAYSTDSAWEVINEYYKP